MLTAVDIRRQITAARFAEGRRLYQEGKVNITDTPVKTAGQFLVRAEVTEDTQPTPYPVRITMDPRSYHVDTAGTYCTCRDMNLNHALCKHIAAAMFAAADWEQKEEQKQREARQEAQEKMKRRLEEAQTLLTKAREDPEGLTSEAEQAWRLRQLPDRPLSEYSLLEDEPENEEGAPADVAGETPHDTPAGAAGGTESMTEAWLSARPATDESLTELSDGLSGDMSDDGRYRIENGSGSSFDSGFAGSSGHSQASGKAAGENSGSSKGKSSKSGGKRRTTNGFGDILRRQAQSRALPVIDSTIYGQVRLEPALVVYEGKVQVSYKIGTGRMYVLKDILTLADRVLDQQEFAYGKNLKFIHMREAFAPECLPLLDLILDWVRENKSQYRQATYEYRYSYRYYERSPVITYRAVKSMPLRSEWLDRFLKIMTGASFSIEFLDSGETQTFTVAAAEEEFRPMLTVEGFDNGIELQAPSTYEFRGRDYWWILRRESGLICREVGGDQRPIADLKLLLSQPDTQGVISVSMEDAPAFCREYLPVLREYYDIWDKDFDETMYRSLEAEIRFYLDAPDDRTIEIRTVAVYGEKMYPVYSGDELGDLSNALPVKRGSFGGRDLLREASAARLTDRYTNARNSEHGTMVLIDDEDLMYELLTEGIAKMQMLGQVYISDALKKLQVHESPKVSVGVSLSGDLLEISMSAEGMSQEELIEVLSRYERRKKYFRLPGGGFVRTEGSGLEALKELQEGLSLSEKDLAKGTVEAPKFLALYIDAHLREYDQIRAGRNRAFRALIRDMKTVEDSDYEIPPELADILREYQKTGYLWLRTLHENGFGGILADEMGLGKTLQVIAFLLPVLKEKETPALVVTPASLVYNWKAELARFAPSIPVRLVVGTAEERRAIIAGASRGEVLVTSYDLLRRDIHTYEGQRFCAQFIDEAQFIKNQGTQTAKAVKLVSASFKCALTGTPMENRLSELWSIFDYLMPGYLGTYASFRKRYEAPVVSNGDEAAAHRLRTMIRPFILRRLKRDVLQDLPDKIEEPMVAELSGEQKELYEAHVQRLLILLDKQTDEQFRHAKIEILSELTKLRLLCCDPSLVFQNYRGGSSKLDLCINLIENAISGGHKILLFSQFTSMLERIETRLRAADIPYLELTGSTPKARRSELTEEFNNGDVPVFCISLKAGGTGLNLASADVVIHYDPWWNVAVENQATDRAHRIGQKNVVNVFKLVLQGTIEENIIRLQERKKELADRILAGEDMGSGSFTKEELLDLLRTE